MWFYTYPPGNRSWTLGPWNQLAQQGPWSWCPWCHPGSSAQNSCAHARMLSDSFVSQMSSGRSHASSAWIGGSQHLKTQEHLVGITLSIRPHDASWVSQRRLSNLYASFDLFVYFQAAQHLIINSLARLRFYNGFQLCRGRSRFTGNPRPVTILSWSIMAVVIVLKSSSHVYIYHSIDLKY